jgi:hypothetical protein
VRTKTVSHRDASPPTFHQRPRLACLGIEGGDRQPRTGVVGLKAGGLGIRDGRIGRALRRGTVEHNITDTHDSERDRSYSNAELRYIARLDEGWKQELEGGRLPLVGLAALAGCKDQIELARAFTHACQPWHDRRGTTGYLSYTFTIPKEISVVAEGHPRKAREAIYAALDKTLTAAFPGKAIKAVTTVHARNEAGEVHYHAHVLIGKFAVDQARRRLFSLNSASSGNTGHARVALLKQEWKVNFDAELEARLGIKVTQGAPYARPALTLADGTYAPALNRERRRVLDKHLCFRLSTATPSGAVTSKNFRWTHFDPTIYELAAADREGGGWSAEAFTKHFPKLAPRLQTFESRVATLKRIGYLTADGRVTGAFTLHYRAHRGDHPELQRLRAELHKLAKQNRGGSAPGGNGPAAPPSGSTESGGGQGAPETGRDEGKDDPNVELWLALHRSSAFDSTAGPPGRLSRPVQGVLRTGAPTAAQSRNSPSPSHGIPGSSARQSQRSGAAQEPAPRPHVLRCSRGKGGDLLHAREGRAHPFARPAGGAGQQNACSCRQRLLLGEGTASGTTGRRLKPLFWLGRLVLPHEVDRMEIAMQRCRTLSTRPHSDPLHQAQLRRAYRNSGDALILQLQDEPRCHSSWRSCHLGRATARGIGDPGSIAPDRHAHLARWAGREVERIAALIKSTKGESNPLSPVETDKPIRQIAKAAGIQKTLSPRLMRRTFQDLGRAADVHDFVVHAISGHATANMQEHDSSVSGEEVRKGLSKVLVLAGLAGGGIEPSTEGTRQAS